MDDTQHSTTTIEEANPLMQPVRIEGQNYLTSQKQHADYLSNALEQGDRPKYTRHYHYKRIIHSIPSYSMLIERKDIVEYNWKSLKHSNIEGNQKLVTLLAPLFAKTGHSDLLLLNATAQMELSHHLDDLLNQEIAYRHSKAGANQGNPYAPEHLLTDERQSRHAEYTIPLEGGGTFNIRLRLPLIAWEIASAIRDVPLHRVNSNHFQLPGWEVHDDLYPWLADAIIDTVRERKTTGLAGGKPDDTYAQHLEPEYWYPAILQMTGAMKMAYSITLQKVQAGDLPPSKKKPFYKTLLHTHIAITGIDIQLPGSERDMTLFNKGRSEIHHPRQLVLV